MFGGRSVEHEISVITALQIFQAVNTQNFEIIPIYLAANGKWYTGDSLFKKDFYQRVCESLSEVREVTLLPDFSRKGFTELSSQKRIPVDACFLAFHGQFGENGCVQALLELADLPYTGCDFQSSAAAMNKFFSKSIVAANGIATLPSVVVKKKHVVKDYAKEKEKILNRLNYPLFVKPNHLGSSVAIGAAKNDKELSTALAEVFCYDDQALIEPRLKRFLEINVAVMDGASPRVSAIEIPVGSQEMLSYEDKYIRGGRKVTGGECSGMAGLSRVIDPVDLHPSIKERVELSAIRSFQLLDCSGMCRFDFLYDTVDDTVYFNEVNPIPGSFAYYLWNRSRPPLLLTELIEKLVDLAKKKKAIQHSLKAHLRRPIR